MATAFSYSGTGLESAIQSGSGGITSTDTSVEVDSIPSDLSAGDTVKVALGTATQWANGNGETVHGEIGTIGGGANGGTNITSLSRGQEGTSASSWSEGDPVRVGVQGREDVPQVGRPVIPAQGQFYPTPHVTKNTRQPDANEIHVSPVPIGRRIPNPEYGVVVDTAGAMGSGNAWVVIYNDRFKRIDYSAVDISTTGEKTATFGKSLPSGVYLVGFANEGLDTEPTYKYTDFGGVIDGVGATDGTVDYRATDYYDNIFNEAEPPQDLISYGVGPGNTQGVVSFIRGLS